MLQSISFASRGKLCFLVSVFLFGFIKTTIIHAQTFTPVTATVNTEIHGYWEYLPSGYSSSSTTYPLMIFFHGTGERGSGSQTDLPKVLKNGPPKLMNAGTFPKSFTVNGNTYSFISICPQMNTDNRSPVMVQELIDYCVKKYRVDKSRIYLTGLSQGGGTVWQYAGSSYWTYSGFEPLATDITAIVPLCGNYPPDAGSASYMADAHLPVWAIHNSGDNIISSQTTIDWINMLNAAGISPAAKCTIINASGHDCWTTGYDPNWRPNGLNVYEWMLQYKRNSDGSMSVPGPAANTGPVAKITGSSSITLPTSTIILDGSGSTDVDGTIKTYTWKYISGPAGYTLSGASTSKLTISSLVAGTYSFQLTVTDDDGTTDTDTFSFTVKAAVNIAPVAKIIGSSSITLPISTIILDGSSSSDADGSIKTYAWKYISGPLGYVLSGATTSKLSILSLIAGTYSFQLTVTDDDGATDAETFSFTVKALVNLAPVAKITGSSTITLPTSTTTLDGSGSADTDGSIKTYAWKYISGPTGYVLSGSSTSKLTITSLDAGTYNFQLTVTDDDGATDTDNFSFTVTDGDLQTPVVIIQDPPTVTLPTTSITLDASESYSPNGNIIPYGYNWRYVSGPGGYTFSNSATAKLTINGLRPYTYTFRLTITDDKGMTGSGTVTFTVNDATARTATGNTISLTKPLTLSMLPFTGTQQNLNGLAIAPVPAVNSLKLFLNNPARGKLAIRITDLNGKLLLQKTSFKDADQWKEEVDISNLSPGMFFIETISGNKRETKKFTKIR